MNKNIITLSETVDKLAERIVSIAGTVAELKDNQNSNKSKRTRVYVDTEGEEFSDDGCYFEPPRKRRVYDTPSHVDSDDNVVDVSDDGEREEGELCAAAETASNMTGLLGDMKKKFQSAEKCGDAITDGLAEIIDGFLSSGCSENSINDMTYHRPKNTKYLQSVQVNNSLWSALPKPVKFANKKYQQIHEGIIAGLLPIIEATDTCLKVAESGGKMPPAASLFSKLKDGIALLADTCHEVGLVRKRALRPHIKEQFRSLCGSQNPITTHLFGDDLSKVTTELNESSKLANKISTPSHERGGRFSNKRTNAPGYSGGRYYQPQYSRYNNKRPDRFLGRPPSTIIPTVTQ